VETDLRDLMRRQFRWTNPGPHSAHLVSDRSGWWRDPAVLGGIGPALAALVADAAPDVVVSPEVTGFLVGPLVATALGVGFVEAYRADRRHPVAEPMAWGAVASDHRGETTRLGIRRAGLDAGIRVLVVDDWLTTGAAVRALYAAVSALGAQPVGAAVIVADCPGEVAAQLRVRSLLTGADLG